MPLPTVLTLIKRNGDPVGSCSLDLWRLPDGQRGVWYGGLIFPLHDDTSIDVADVALPPAKCQPALEPMGPMRWVISAEGADSYVFVAGTGRDLQQTLEQLKQAGVGVLRSGPNLSQQPADWFIRCEGQVAAGAIGLVLESNRAEASSDFEAGVTGSAALRLRLISEALAASEAVRERLQGLLATAQQGVALDTQARAELAQALKELEQERLTRATLEAELRKPVEVQTVSTRAKPGRLSQELEIIAGTLLPRLEFLPGSLEFMATELPSRKGAFDKLGQIERTRNDWPPGWKRIKAHDTWWECHFSTGQDDQGRIYARPLEALGKLQVLVSHKQDQSRDLKRLA